MEIKDTSYGGLGLVAVTDLSPSDIVVQVPSDLVLDVVTPGDANSDALSLFEDQQVYRKLPWWAQLSVRLNALDKGFSNVSSRCQPWLDVLPRKFNTPLHWSDKEVSELQYEFLMNSVRNQKSQWKSVYDDIISGAKADMKKSLSFEDFVWGCECARSRAFSGAYAGSAFNPAPYAFTLLLVTLYVGAGLGTVEQASNGAAVVLCGNVLKDFVLPKFFKLKKYVICPFIDMANHIGIGESGDVAFEYFGDSYSLTMKGQLSKGNELMISYGSRSNDQLLQYYGFVEEKNSHDVYIMPALRDWDIDALERVCGRPFGSDRLVKIDRAGLLGSTNSSSNTNNEGDNINSLGGIIVSRAGGIDPAVMQALRAMVSSDTEWQNAGEAVGNFVEKISDQNERLARLAARTELEAELKRKPTSIEDDEKLLRQMKGSKSVVSSEEELCAIKFRIEKKKLLKEVISSLE